MAFGKIVDKIGIKKADFLVVNNDWGIGTADEFGKMLKEHAMQVGLVERMDASAQDMSAQLSKIKADRRGHPDRDRRGGAVVARPQASGRPWDAGEDHLTGGSQNPDQLIENVGKAADGTMHLTFFAPWAPEATPDSAATKAFIDEWRKKGLPFASLTQSFRGYDGIRTIAEAIKLAGKAEPDAIRAAFWKVNIGGLNGPIKFEKNGPAGQESGQSTPNVYLVKIENGKASVPKM